MLYIIATPIGNMGDITLRALETLKSVDLIAAEDTRHTLKLLSFYNIQKPLISYFEHNKLMRGNMILERLKRGENVALVSDAGTPGISDPGEDLVRLAIENGIETTMLPGPAACINALVLSGLPTGRFVFEGFLPEDKKKRAKALDTLKCEERTSVFYESPHNILKTLKELIDVTGMRTVVLGREMTKKFEEFRRGTAEEHLAYFEINKPRGEFAIVVEGYTPEEKLPAASDEEVFALVNDLAKENEKKAAVKLAASMLGISKNQAYAIYEKVKKQST